MWLPFVTTPNPEGHKSRRLHRNETSIWSGVHNPHQGNMVGTFFAIKGKEYDRKDITNSDVINKVNTMKWVRAKNGRNYTTVNIPPGKTLVFKGQNIFHRAPNSIRKNAPLLFQTNEFQNIKNAARLNKSPTKSVSPTKSPTKSRRRFVVTAARQDS